VDRQRLDDLVRQLLLGRVCAYAGTGELAEQPPDLFVIITQQHDRVGAHQFSSIVVSRHAVQTARLLLSYPNVGSINPAPSRASGR
jgi:hypothetical protein